MFDWLRRLDPETSGIAKMMRQFSQMLTDGRHMFDTAANALFGGTDPEIIRSDLFATDRRINDAEIQIRRGIVVHGTVHGAADLPPCLLLMSLVKDAERIGDYAKNLFDLATQVDRFARDETFEDLVDLKDRVSRLLGETRQAFDDQDADEAREGLILADRLQDQCDSKVEALVRGRLESPHPAATVLAYRYQKRILAHAMNILTSVVVPLDRLDFFDERPRPRIPRGKEGPAKS